MNSDHQDDVYWERASVEVLRNAINHHKASGTLQDFLNTTAGRRKDSPSGQDYYVLLGTPFHYGCCDPNGERGEAKIALLFQACFDAGLSPEALAKKHAKISRGVPYWDHPRVTPLHLLARNPAATEKVLRMVCGTWPNALFTTASGSDCEYFNPGNPLCYALAAEDADEGLSSRVGVLLDLARPTEQGVKAMVSQSRRPQVTCETALQYCVWLEDSATADQVRDIFGQLLRACPEASMLTDLQGRNWIHAFRGVRDGNFFPMLKIFVECVPLEVLVAVLSTEEYGHALQFTQTPICIIRLLRSEIPGTVHFLETLASTDAHEDPNGRTLLHYAAANSLCDGDPHEKAERETERNRRMEYQNEFPIRTYGSGDLCLPLPPPLTCERQGTRKLVEWLLEVNPRACSIRDHQGRLPLHLALATGKTWNNGVQSLARAYPEAVGLRDPVSGRLPLHVAIEAGMKWTNGVESLIYTYPAALEIRDPDTGLCPYLLAASQPEADINIIYSFLRLKPDAIAPPIIQS